MIRPATLADRAQLYGLALEYTELYPLRPEKVKLLQIITEAISAKRNFIRVSHTPRGKIEGALVALTSENIWAQKQCCHIIFWASLIHGDGIAMLREFKRWVKDRQVIRVAGFAPDLKVDPRIWKLAERVGFIQRGGAYLWYRGGDSYGFV